MTDNSDETVPVEQCDRDAEAAEQFGKDFRAEQASNFGCGGEIECCFPMDGNCGCFNAVLARHRRAAQSPPPVVSEGVVEASPNLITQIARLLAADPVCGGRVASGTIEAIAGICSRGCDAGEDYGPGSPWSEGYNSGFAAASREPSRGCDLETVEACAKVCEQQMQDFLSPEYATGQPLSSVQERIACKMCAAAIRNLGNQHPRLERRCP